VSAEKYSGVEKHVGRTPLIRLRRLSELTGCEILGKAEWLNPGGSIKDRAALGIILDAEQRGQLRSGDTIIEGTAGNTGIGLTVIGHAKGYRTVIVIPETQSPEKITLLRTLGAEVITVPEKPYSDPDNYNHVAARLAAEKGWFWANQFDNPPTASRTTAPPARRFGNKPAAPSPGLFLPWAPVARWRAPRCFCRSKTPSRRGLRRPVWCSHVVLVHPRQSGHQGWRFRGRRHRPEPRIPDQEAVTIVYQLLREEGIFLGLSSCINLAGALRLARERGPGQTIVTLLCDSGHKYQSKLFNPAWLAAHQLDPGQKLETLL